MLTWFHSDTKSTLTHQRELLEDPVETVKDPWAVSVPYTHYLELSNLTRRLWRGKVLVAPLPLV